MYGITENTIEIGVGEGKKKMIGDYFTRVRESR